MYHVEIVLDRKKIEKKNLNYNELMDYIDYVYDFPEIIKTGEGKFDGISCERELGVFGNANIQIEKDKELFSVLKKWIMWDDHGDKEDIIASKLRWERSHGRS